MPRRLLVLAGLLALVLVAFALAGDRPRNARADVSLDSEELAFVSLINDWRAQNGAAPLTIYATLTDASEWMNGDMGQNHYFSHVDSLGRQPWDRMCDFGYCYNTYRGENIAAGFTTAQSVFDAWKNSPGHNGNMLNPNYKIMGLSRLSVPGSDYNWYWTNDFAGYVPPVGVAAPTKTPAPGATLAPTPSSTPTTAPTATPSRTPSPTPSRTPSPTPSQSPTPAPTLAPTPTPAGCSGDLDCDGWSNVAETSIGTSPNLKCSTTFARNDEAVDALPVDLNDDRIVNGSDALMFNRVLGTSNPRYDLNRSGTVNFADLAIENSWMFFRC